MSVFNSLGTNYTPAMVWKSLRPAKLSAHRDLDKQLHELYSAKTVLLTNRGREAIVAILRSLSLPKDSRVVITGYTCYVVYEAVLAADLTPHFVDIEKDNLNFTAKSLEKALEAQPDIKAVVVQNTMGLPADIDAISRLCEKHNIHLIEDLAHSAGLVYDNGSKAGTVGVAAALSFSQNKMIDASAGGAAIFRNDISLPTLKSVLLGQKISNYFYPLTTLVIRSTHRFVIGKVLLRVVKALHILPDPAAGYAGDLHKLPRHQAMLASAYIDQLDNVIKHRQRIASIYRELLPDELLFAHSSGATYIRFPIHVDDQPSLEKYLKQFRINLGTSWYETVIAPRRFLKRATLYKPGSCPNGEWMAEHMINLPTHANVSESKARFIAEKVNQWLQSK